MKTCTRDTQDISSPLVFQLKLEVLTKSFPQDSYLNIYKSLSKDNTKTQNLISTRKAQVEIFPELGYQRHTDQ